MKILNTYKQGSVTWFEHKHLFGISKKLTTFTDDKNSLLSGWLKNSDLTITKRTKDIL